MWVCIDAIWEETFSDYSAAMFVYDVPDEHCGSEDSILALFGKIARDFAAETEDEYAKEQISYGFDWGVFWECVGEDKEFLARYGVTIPAIEMCGVTVGYYDDVNRYKEVER